MKMINVSTILVAVGIISATILKGVKDKRKLYSVISVIIVVTLIICVYDYSNTSSQQTPSTPQTLEDPPPSTSSPIHDIPPEVGKIISGLDAFNYSATHSINGMDDSGTLYNLTWTHDLQIDLNK